MDTFYRWKEAIRKSKERWLSWMDPSRNTCIVEQVREAVQNEDLIQLSKLLKPEAVFGCSECCGSGPYHFAISYNKNGVFNYLILHHRDRINQQNTTRNTPLLLAVSSEETFHMANKLILFGADVNIDNIDHTTPLHKVVKFPQLVRLLIECSADLDARDRLGNTPLHYAVKFNCLETVYMLLYYNAGASIINYAKHNPFMTAMKRQNDIMEEILFEYMDDYEFTAWNADYSVLGYALMYSSPFAEEMIHRGADVDHVGRYVNAFALTIQHFRSVRPVFMNVFKLVWEKMDYRPAEMGSVFASLRLLDRGIFHDVVDIFIETDKFPVLVESVTLAADLSQILLKCIDTRLPFEKLSTFLYLLLSHGYNPHETDLVLIFKYWGDCEPFRILLHMQIRQGLSFPFAEKFPQVLIYNAKLSSNRLLKQLTSLITRYPNFNDFVAIIIFRILDYCVYPPLIDAYINTNRNDCVTIKINALPRVPSLIELARNKTRQHIKKSYNVKRCSTMYTLIHNLDIPDDYKKILTFETIIYKPTYTRMEFWKIIAFLRRIPERRQLIDLLINTTAKNSVILP